MLGSSQETLYRWLMALPDEVVRARPVLSVYYAFALLGRGGFEAFDAHLRDAERWLTRQRRRASDEAPSVEMVVVDEVAFRSCRERSPSPVPTMPGRWGDVFCAADHARRALDLLPDDDHLWRGAASLLGIAYWTSGDLEAAYWSFADGVSHQQMTGHVRFQIAGTYILADIRIAQGRLNEAVRTYEQSLQVAKEQGEPVWGTANLYVGLSELHRERGDLEAAKQHLLRSRSWASTSSGYRRRAIAGTLLWRESRRPKVTLTARSICSTRRSASMSKSRPRRASRSGAEDAGAGCAGSIDRSLGWTRSEACPPTTTSATCTPSTSPWRGCSWPDTARSGRTPHSRGDGAPGAPPGKRRKRAGGWVA